MLRELAGGASKLEVAGTTVREVVRGLEPGLRERLMDGEQLRPNISVAVDGEVTPLGLMEAVGPESEVHFVLAISGGLG